MLVNEAKRMKLDVICLQETRILGQDSIQINGYDIYWSGHAQKHQAGVAIMVKEYLVKYIIEVQCLSD